MTGLYSFTNGVLKMLSLICASASVLKFSSNEHVFERLCFLVRHDWWLREDYVKFWLVLDKIPVLQQYFFNVWCRGVVFDNKRQNLLARFRPLLQISSLPPRY